MRLGVFGGTFDPPHIGHLIVAADVAAALELDRVLFIPAGTHPLKRSEVQTPGRLRLEMVEAAIEGADRFVADDRELRRSGPSYTVDTLRELREERPGAELYLLIGSDILNELDRWHGVREIDRLAEIAVMSRAGVDVELPEVPGLGPSRVEVTHVGISSTEVRRRVRDGGPYRYLVPEGVFRIIQARSLYKKRD